MKYNIQLNIGGGAHIPVCLRIIYDFFQSGGSNHYTQFLSFIPIQTTIPTRLVEKEERVLRQKIVDCIFDPTSFKIGTEITVWLEANGNVYRLPLNENRRPAITKEEFFTPKEFEL